MLIVILDIFVALSFLLLLFVRVVVIASVEQYNYDERDSIILVYSTVALLLVATVVMMVAGENKR